MSAKLVELTELEKCFYKTSRAEVNAQLESVIKLDAVVTTPKKMKIRECADLRYWWDDESSCALDSAG